MMLSVIAASVADAECVVDALPAPYVVARRGKKVEVSYDGAVEPPIAPVLQALEDCLTANELPPIKLRLNGKRYTMYARADA